MMTVTAARVLIQLVWPARPFPRTNAGGAEGAYKATPYVLSPLIPVTMHSYGHIYRTLQLIGSNISIVWSAVKIISRNMSGAQEILEVKSHIRDVPL